MLYNNLLSLLQFGMLIQYLFEEFPDTDDVTEREIGDLQVSKVSS